MSAGLSYGEQRAKNEAEILALLAGDEVAFTSPSGRMPVVFKVERVTETKVFVRGLAFHRKGGRSFEAGEDCGSSRFHREKIRALTPELRAELDAAANRASLERRAQAALAALQEHFVWQRVVRTDRTDVELEALASFAEGFKDAEPAEGGAS